MEQDINYWVELAHIDLDSARRSLAGESYLHCIFGCQQALEKLLKGLVVKNTRQAAPRVHNLIRLATLAGLTLDSVQEIVLSKLSLEYIEMRYPEEVETIAELNTLAAAEEHLQQTEGLFQWLEARIK